MATISFTTKFDLTQSPKLFVFEDTTDYVGQGIALINVNGVFNITSPSGTVIYNNTNYSNGSCDIRNSVDRENQTTIQLPLGADGLVEAGTYVIAYSVYDNNALEYYTVTNTYNYEYVRPTVSITQTCDCISPLFTSRDTTNYVVAGVSPTSTVRQHILAFPLGSGLSPLTSASATITAGFEEFANGTQATEITSTITYIFDDELTVKDEIIGAQEFKVDCTYICAVYCGIRSIEQQMVAAECDPVRYNALRLLFGEIAALVQLAKLAIECGKPDDVAGYLTRMRTIGNFTDDCSCSGDEPTLVTGLGGAGNTVIVESGGEPVVVDSVVVGSTTTYTVTLTQEFIDSVNEHYATVVEAGTGVTVTDSGIVAGVRTFTIDADAIVPVVLYDNTVQASTSAGVMTSLMSYTIAADQMAVNDDTIQVSFAIDTSACAESKALELRLAGVVCHPKVPILAFAKGVRYMSIVATISRQTATTVFIKFDVIVSNTRYGSITGWNFFESGIAVNNLDTLTNVVELFGRNVASGSETVRANQMLVKYFNK